MVHATMAVTKLSLTTCDQTVIWLCNVAIVYNYEDNVANLSRDYPYSIELLRLTLRSAVLGLGS